MKRFEVGDRVRVRDTRGTYDAVVHSQAENGDLVVFDDAGLHHSQTAAECTRLIKRKPFRRTITRQDVFDAFESLKNEAVTPAAISDALSLYR